MHSPKPECVHCLNFQIHSAARLSNGLVSTKKQNCERTNTESRSKMIHLLKRLLLLISLVILPLLAICVFRYHLYFANVPQETRCADDKRHQPITDRDGLVRRFSQALQFKTITKSIGEVDPVELVKFTNWIKRSKCFASELLLVTAVSRLSVGRNSSLSIKMTNQITKTFVSPSQPTRPSTRRTW